MKSSRIKLLSLSSATVCWCVVVGCNSAETDMASERQTDKTIPSELLIPEFLQSLSISISHDCRQRETKSQPLNFPADSPQARRAHEFLLRLLSLKEAKRLPLGDVSRRSVRVVYRRTHTQEAVFAVYVDPEIDGVLEIYVWEKPGATREMVRAYSVNERILESLNDLWDFCARDR